MNPYLATILEQLVTGEITRKVAKQMASKKITELRGKRKLGSSSLEELAKMADDESDLSIRNLAQGELTRRQKEEAALAAFAEVSATGGAMMGSGPQAAADLNEVTMPPPPVLMIRQWMPKSLEPTDAPEDIPTPVLSAFPEMGVPLNRLRKTEGDTYMPQIGAYILEDAPGTLDQDEAFLFLITERGLDPGRASQHLRILRNSST